MKNYPSTYKIYRKLRRDWGDIKPTTRIIPNKKKKPKEKHKGKWKEEI